ncbi:hypothetical protein [Caulobacter sp. 17J80-11]|uniref:hypothetical protein n=1 Tax=Caulobacter sp. 17J80-11 TaxID=2763502 RepID=UPI001653B919|nr:hypothetical protein [Caulobacter sp. 17J80-11]MBC6980448.1 hypothetical protein [Caulobacter sp. 17J80-11]
MARSRTTARLTLVPPAEEARTAAPEAVVAAPEPKAESPAQRIKRLQAEAQSLAREHVGVLQSLLKELAVVAEEIADGGDAYPVGAREIARRLAEDVPRTGQTLQAVLNKAF